MLVDKIWVSASERSEGKPIEGAKPNGAWVNKYVDNYLINKIQPIIISNKKNIFIFLFYFVQF